MPKKQKKQGLITESEQCMSDIEKAVATAQAIGDDRLQKASRGVVVPDSFTHGSSAQRVQWLQRGLQSGQIDSCNTFNQQ